MENQMLLYITGSYPEYQEGIASGAKVLLDAMAQVIGRDRIILLTTDTPIITNSIKKNTVVEYTLMKNWKVNRINIENIEAILDKYPISTVHMEYPGDLYGKTFLASLLPWVIHRYNKKHNRNITVNVRLHEFSRARMLRKIAILPLLQADRIYVPGQRDRNIVAKMGKTRVKKTIIGTNIMIVPTEEDIKKENKQLVVSYFGAVYPGKGIEKMLYIWKKLKDQNSDVRFSFKLIGGLGSEKDYHKTVWKLIDSLGLRDVIEVTGFLPEKDVSREIQKSSVATLFYEDGLTLRRGSFLAYLAHGIPIVTTTGDDECKEMFSNHPGIAMADNDFDIIQAINKYLQLSDKERESIKMDNTDLSRSFNWDTIARTFLSDYKMI